VHSNALVGRKIVSAAAMSFLSKELITLPYRFLNTASWHPEHSALSSVLPVLASKNLSPSYNFLSSPILNPSPAHGQSFAEKLVRFSVVIIAPCALSPIRIEFIRGALLIRSDLIMITYPSICSHRVPFSALGSMAV
jgi:hypothetical protein